MQPLHPRLLISHLPLEKNSADMVVFFLPQLEGTPPHAVSPLADDLVANAAKWKDFSAKEGETLLGYRDDVRFPRVLVVGLGKGPYQPDHFRKAAGTAVKRALATRATRILLTPPKIPHHAPEVLESFAEGAVLAAYRFDKYRKPDPEEPAPVLREIAFSFSGRGVRKALARGRVSAVAAWAARDMANEPGNHFTPDHFADSARELAGKYPLKCRILGEKEMKRLGMGGILGVNQGSAKPPRLIILEYRPGRAKSTLLLVGKGLTFDSGGISLKPSAGMEEMKYDMCGGAAVLAAIQGIAEERPKGVNVVGLIPATENLPGPAALKPGDVIRMYGGKTVEVVNTDAEGRLILADALAYGVERFKPDAVIDLATLTGAVIIGLGHHRTGLIANNDTLAGLVTAAADQAGEPVWRLPLGPEYTKQLKSAIADLKNVDKRDAGTILGGAFLAEFVGSTPWVHLDIAGTAWNFTEKPYVPKGPSGIGVRTLINLVRAWKPGTSL